MRLGKRQDDVGDPWDSPDPALAVATRQLEWYAQHQTRARIAHAATEALLLLTAAGATLAAALQASAWATASLAATTLVLTGLRKVFDWHDSWVAFAVAWADLRTAVYEHRLRGKDRLGEDAQRRLIAIVNEIVTEETGRWATRRRRTGIENQE